MFNSENETIIEKNSIVHLLQNCNIYLISVRIPLWNLNITYINIVADSEYQINIL